MGNKYRQRSLSRKMSKKLPRHSRGYLRQREHTKISLLNVMGIVGAIFTVFGAIVTAIGVAVAFSLSRQANTIAKSSQTVEQNNVSLIMKDHTKTSGYATYNAETKIFTTKLTVQAIPQKIQGNVKLMYACYLKNGEVVTHTIPIDKKPKPFLIFQSMKVDKDPEAVPIDWFIIAVDNQKNFTANYYAQKTYSKDSYFSDEYFRPNDYLTISNDQIPDSNYVNKKVADYATRYGNIYHKMFVLDYTGEKGTHILNADYIHEEETKIINQLRSYYVIN
ncbi:hypothetical protein FC83_GL002110 [Agrilactobacillus composti DSM 18527 = JCM 14202]|uniref:Uncharacterized protein n=1 Tax=Agrilactobacillus composti DSM 18527 = JCM 14202 TaxID=1423734 RepID=A0A0R1XXG8_9LACO|nr:hypothetical protein FC83_GL002110 [Agrilactobacillus composti DSM 18527 = JCM 14202]